MRAAIRVLGALALAFASAVGGAMLTTNFSTMRANGASYLPAVQAGLKSIVHALAGFVTSLWFVVPVAALLLVILTARATLRISRPKRDGNIELGRRMNVLVNAAHHDQKFRRFTSHYMDTMRVCREMEAFMVEVQMQGIPVPSPQSDSAEEWIDLSCEFLTAVGPYLRNGNFPHAVAAAQAFADRYPHCRA